LALGAGDMFQAIIVYSAAALSDVDDKCSRDAR
jgi:hypothetical protein